MRLEEVPWEGWKNLQRIEDMLDEKYRSKGTNGKHNLGRFKSDSTSQLQYFTKLSEWWNIRNEVCATPLMVRREQANKPMDFDIVLAEPLPNPINPALTQKVAAYKETCNHVRKSSVQVGTSKAYPLEHLHMEIMGTVKALTSSKQIDDMPSVDIFMCMLQKCREIKKLACAKHVHILICDYGLEAFGALGKYFVLMFLECGSVFDAQQAFNRLVHQNELSWTSLIHGYIESGEWWHALNLLQQIRGDCEYASSCNFVVLLKACANRKWMKRGQELHTEIAKEACERELIIGTALLDMYAKCGALAEAQDVFDKLVVRDVVSWTALIGGYADHRLGEEALGFLEQMQLEGVPMNAFTYVCSLKACSGIGDITRGRKLHAKIAKDGLERDYFVCSTLVNMYAEFGLLVEARRVLDKLPVIHVVSWNALITGYVEHGFGQEALRCLEQMQAEGVSPNAVTHVCSLKACGSIGAIDKGREIHAAVNKEGLEGDIFIGSTLVDMYAACGSLAEAQEVFGQLPVRDVVSWTALIGGYIGHGLGKEAISCLEQMQLEGISPNGVTFVCSLKACGSQGSVDKGRELHFEIAKEGFERDPFVGNTLVDMYAKCGSLVEALEVFDELPVRNVVSWNALIAAYSEHGLCEEALNCLEQMEVEFMSPDAVTYVSCLKACGSIGAMERGRELHAKIVKEGFERDPFLCGTLVEIYSAGRRNPSVETHGASERESIIIVLANALIDMYGKCGSMVDSQKVFDAMPTRDLLTWTGLVTGYSRQGECKLVFHLFERMRKEGIQPDGITFLSLLNVCSHVGLLDKGQKYFEMMSNYGITKTIEHHNCMVDLFGRAGLFDKAMVVLEEMPFEPDPVTWSTMLCACRRWGTVELGRQAFKYAAEMKESGATAFVLMSNMYAAAHMCED